MKFCFTSRCTSNRAWANFAVLRRVTSVSAATVPSTVKKGMCDGWGGVVVVCIAWRRKRSSSNSSSDDLGTETPRRLLVFSLCFTFPLPPPAFLPWHSMLISWKIYLLIRVASGCGCGCVGCGAGGGFIENFHMQISKKCNGKAKERK